MPFASAVALTPIVLTERAAINIATMTAADGTNGNKFVANRNSMLRVKNASGSSITVTIHTNYSVYGQALSDFTFTVPATTGDVLYTGFETIFDQNNAKEVWVTFSAVTSVTVAVYNPL